MITTCPKCGTKYDIPECAVVSAAARINGKRSTISSERARELQARSAEARRAKRDAKQGKGE